MHHRSAIAAQAAPTACGAEQHCSLNLHQKPKQQPCKYLAEDLYKITENHVF